MPGAHPGSLSLGVVTESDPASSLLDWLSDALFALTTGGWADPARNRGPHDSRRLNEEALAAVRGRSEGASREQLRAIANEERAARGLGEIYDPFLDVWIDFAIDPEESRRRLNRDLRAAAVRAGNRLLGTLSRLAEEGLRTWTEQGSAGASKKDGREEGAGSEEGVGEEDAGDEVDAGGEEDAAEVDAAADRPEAALSFQPFPTGQRTLRVRLDTTSGPVLAEARERAWASVLGITPLQLELDGVEAAGSEPVVVTVRGRRVGVLDGEDGELLRRGGPTVAGRAVGPRTRRAVGFLVDGRVDAPISLYLHLPPWVQAEPDEPGA